LWTSPVMPWDVAKSTDLAKEPGVDFVIDISAYRSAKAAALRAHRTQHVSIDRHFFDLPEVDRILSVETFRQCFGPALSKRPASDLFESISPLY
jgi:LmbE family N-acetylglucosaminyl deacetylase